MKELEKQKESWCLCLDLPHRNSYYVRENSPEDGDVEFMEFDTYEDAMAECRRLDYWRLCEYLNGLSVWRVDPAKDLSIHAVAAATGHSNLLKYKERADSFRLEPLGPKVEIVHRRIRCPEDLQEVASDCPNSQIRLIFVTPDGRTFGEDIWAYEVLQQEVLEVE